MPEDPLLREVADATGLIGPNMAGITLGYGIFIVNYSSRNTSRVSQALEIYRF
jgi:hypothetical protein